MALVARAAMYATAPTMKDRTISLALESEDSSGMDGYLSNKKLFPHVHMWKRLDQSGVNASVVKNYSGCGYVRFNLYPRPLTCLHASDKKQPIRRSCWKWTCSLKEMPGCKSRPDRFAAVPEVAPGQRCPAVPRNSIFAAVVSCHMVQLQSLAEQLGE